jgi:hypothetical protein
MKLNKIDKGLNKMTTQTNTIHQVAEFKKRNPLGAIRTIQYEDKGVTAAISCYRFMHGVMMYGVYDEKYGYTYYSPEN